MADPVEPPLRPTRRAALLLACLTAMSPILARSADSTSGSVPAPRRRVGVRRFDVKPSFASISAADAAAHIEAALIIRLEASGCCRVVGRDLMAPPLTTMEAGRPPASGRNSAPPPDEVLAAQFIIAGSVTVISPPDFGYHTWDGAPHRRESVEVDVQLSDARTAMVLGAFQAERRLPDTLSERGGRASVGGTDRFFASALGQATDLALTDIVAQIVGALTSLP